MRLILHIGANKTGTSTLQATLHDHAGVLAEAGVLYPATSHHAFNHSPLVCRFKPLDAMPRGFTRSTPDGAALRRAGEECWDEILEQVRRSGAETCVLSSEYFFNLRELGDLAELLRTEFDEVRVVAYVRPPHSQYLSEMQQHVKASPNLTAPRDWRYRIREHLSRHLDVFGDDITVRGFDRSVLVHGCIVRDFAATAFPPAAGALTDTLQVKDRNESSSAETVCVMQNLRRYGWPEQDEKRIRARGRVMQALRELESRGTGTPPRLRPGIAAKITEAHTGALAWLRDRFGIEFDAPEDAWTAEHDPDGWSSDRFAEILDVDHDRVERVYAELVRELATSTGSTRHVLRRLRRFVPRALAGFSRSR